MSLSDARRPAWHLAVHSRGQAASLGPVGRTGAAHHPLLQVGDSEPKEDRGRFPSVLFTGGCGSCAACEQLDEPSVHTEP